ncbi:complex I assembly factor TIMMDC1, mitochondrial-like [Salmo trutta]|uniref:complex I assembly factor TIMMDC1, mitochondrial-like n=1 Tax=Salmo trutta TaxID=8032 RepID=UPI0011320D0E|nr:complex I assembly factor TIMMDC1, mitochondrial-like [Salmo trutta]XP_029596396.1 complex I assembly factor TIMMDC1, mitochondrial-like [Salmo trutta]
MSASVPSHLDCVFDVCKQSREHPQPQPGARVPAGALIIAMQGLAGALIIAMQGLAGALIIAMQGLAGETVWERRRRRRRRERRDLYELQLAEWSSRLQLTDDLIGDLSSSGRTQDVDKDIQKIQELLGLPRNESVAQD